MSKRWFGVAAVGAAALGCAMAAENPAPKLTPAVTSAPPAVAVAPLQQRDIGAGVNNRWSVNEATNAARLAAMPLPNDIPAVQALHEQIFESLSVLVRRQVDMQVAASDQMNKAREYRAKLRTDDPELLKLQQRLAAINSERDALILQISEHFNQDNQYQQLTQQRGDGVKKLRDMGSLTGVLREKMALLEQRQAELERQDAAAAATNQVQDVQAPRSATPKAIIKQ